MNTPSLDTSVPSGPFLSLWTKNDCANGSPPPPTLRLLLSTTTSNCNSSRILVAGCSVTISSTSAVLNESICSCVVWLNPVAL